MIVEFQVEGKYIVRMMELSWFIYSQSKLSYYVVSKLKGFRRKTGRTGKRKLHNRWRQQWSVPVESRHQRLLNLVHSVFHLMLNMKIIL